MGLFSHWCIPFNSIESIFLLHATYKMPQNTNRFAGHKWGKGRASVKADESHSHKYYSYFQTRKETEVTKTNSLTGSKSSGGIFILLLQAEEGKKIPLIFITINSPTKWEKEKWRIPSCYSYSVSLLHGKKRMQQNKLEICLQSLFLC